MLVGLSQYFIYLFMFEFYNRIKYQLLKLYSGIDCNGHGNLTKAPP